MARAGAAADGSVVEEPGVVPEVAAAVEEPAAGERWLRVKNNQSGHEVTKLASVVKRAAKGVYTVLPDKAAVGGDGKPLPPKYRRELGE